MVTPGFIDAHVHFVTGGFRLSSVQLRDAKTPEEFVRRIREFAATVPAGTWITGGDWDHEQWGGRLPERSWIDSVTPDHPVWVNRLDGHMALANSAALRAANVSSATRDVDGGAIVREDRRRTDRHPQGQRAEPRRAGGACTTRVLQDRALDTAMTYVASNGVTADPQHGHVVRCRDLRARARGRTASRPGSTPSSRSRRGSNCATPSRRAGTATTGSGSAA